jgi:hypothetical protein
MSNETTPKERPVSQLVKFPATRMTLEQAKKEHDEWHPVYIEDCLWCRSEVALPSVRAALQASEEREAKLRALCDRIDKVKHLSKPGNGVKEAIVGQIRAIIGGKP